MFIHTWSLKNEWQEKLFKPFYFLVWAISAKCLFESKKYLFAEIPYYLCFSQFIRSSNDSGTILIMCYSILCQQIWKNQQWPQDWKRSVFIPIPKKGNAKEGSNYHTIALISHTFEVMLKFSKPGFSNTWTVNFQMFKLVLEKAEEPEIKLPTSTGSWKKQESSRKTSISALLTIPKPLCSVQFSCSVLSNFLWPHESQHTSPPCPSPTPRVHSNSCPSSRWCHPAISSSVVPFSFCPQSLPASESFP